MRKLTTNRWNWFANRFADHIIKNFPNNEFTVQAVKDSVDDNLVRLYKQILPDLSNFSRAIHWDLVEFDRINKWLKILVDGGVLTVRDKQPHEKIFGRSRNIYKVVAQEDQPTVKEDRQLILNLIQKVEQLQNKVENLKDVVVINSEILKAYVTN